MTPLIAPRTPSPASLGLLLIDDNPHDRELLTRELSEHFGSPSIIPVRDAYELEHAVTFAAFDAAIIDYQLKWATGIDVLRRIKRSHWKQSA